MADSWLGNTASHPFELIEYRPGSSPQSVNERRREWLDCAYNEAQSWIKESNEAQEMPKQILYLLGQQWTQRRPSYKAAPVNNRLLRSMEETIAILTDIRPVFTVKSNSKIFDDQADLMTNITRAWWMKNRVEFKLAQALMYAYLTTGFLRIVWDRNLCEGRGDFALQPLSIYELLPIGPQHSLQDWEGCIYEGVRTISWFRRTFPVEGSRVRPSGNLMRYAKPLQRSRTMGQTQFDMLAPQMQRWVGSPRSYGESVVAQAWYREFWVRDFSLNISNNVVKMGGGNWGYEVNPGEMLYPRGRLIITGGDNYEVMYDGPNYLWHGKWPFVMLRLKPMPWQVHGISSLKSKIPLQDIVNQILAGVLDTIKKAVNPPLLFQENSFSPAVQAAMDPNMPNAKIGYSNLTSQPPQYQTPPQLPSYVQNTLQYAQNEMDDDSGLIDLGGLGRKKVTPAGDTLDALKEGQQTLMRSQGRYIDYAVMDLGEQMVPNFFQFYTLERRMWMFGVGGVTFQDVFDGNTASLVPSGIPAKEHARMFSFDVVSGSLLKINQQEDALLAMALRRQGDMDRKTLYQQLDLEKVYEQVKTGLEEEQQQQMQLGGLGGPLGGGMPMPAHKMGKGSDNVQNLLRQG